MRILYVIHQFYPEFGGGTEHVALQLARMAQRAGHYVQVLACGVEPGGIAGTPLEAPLPGCVQAVHQGVPVLFVPRAALPATADISLEADAAVAQALAGWMQSQHFELAHVMHTMRMASAVLALQQLGLPYLLTLTDFYLPCARINLIDQAGRLCPGPEQGARCARACPTPPWSAPAYAARYEQAAALLAGAAERCAPSAYVAERYRAAFPGLPVRVLPHGVDLLRFAGNAPAAAGRDAAAPLRLAYVGTLVHQKGVDVLLRAMARLRGAPVTLTVVGGFWGNSGYHAEVKALAQGDARIEFTGKLEPAAVFERLQQADLLCLPSRVPESFSLVLQEAAAAGLPALVPDLGAPPEFVQAHGCGRVVPAGDDAAWAAAIGEVLAQPGLLQEWRRRLPLPLRVEEEAFFYESLFRRMQREPAPA